MRNAFARELKSLAAADPRVVLLSGDIGNRMFDDFKSEFPNRFYNCGVAEANMMGMAAGLAICGLRPVVYTIVPFVTTRCLEQIRVDVCYHRAPVVIAGVGGGLSYAGLGATHHSCEDIAMLRMLPEMTVICPGDPVEAEFALKGALAHEGPVYLRLGKKGEPPVHPSPPDFKIGKGLIVREGRDVTLLSTGNVLPLAVQTAELLERHQIGCGVVSMHTVKPLDRELLAALSETCACLVTLEEHSINGGLGGAVSEWLADHPQSKAKLLRIGTPDEFMHKVGNQSDMRRIWGLEPKQIVPRIQGFIAKTRETANP